VTEELITIAIVQYLSLRQWTIISYDFPQSGSGYRFTENFTGSCSSCKALIPDIIAQKEGQLFIWENKVKFSVLDIEKYRNFTSSFSNSIESLRKETSFQNMFFGIGVAHSLYNIKKIDLYSNQLDFAVIVDQESTVIVKIPDSYGLLI